MYFIPEMPYSSSLYSELLINCINCSWCEIERRKFVISHHVSDYTEENKAMLFHSLKLAAFNLATYAFSQFYREILKKETINRVTKEIGTKSIGNFNKHAPYCCGMKLSAKLKTLFAYFGRQVQLALIKVWKEFKDQCPKSEVVARSSDEDIYRKISQIRDEHRNEIYKIITDTFVDCNEPNFELTLIDHYKKDNYFDALFRDSDSD